MRTKNEKSSLTYIERSQRLENKARLALLAGASTDYMAAKAAVEGGVKLEIQAVNRLRACGLKLLEAGVPTGSHQIEWLHNNAQHLPAGFSSKSIKVCAHLARKLDRPVERMDEARAAQQMMFEAFAVVEAPKRIGTQQAHEHNPWNEFVSKAMGLTALFEKLEEKPMGEWGRPALEKFVATTDPIVKRNQDARALLA